jgi:hypothetical protein
MLEAKLRTEVSIFTCLKYKMLGEIVILKYLYIRYIDVIGWCIYVINLIGSFVGHEEVLLLY